jgi:hypothetical protein
MKQICTQIAFVCALFCSANAFSQNVNQGFDTQTEVNGLLASCWTLNNFTYTSSSAITGSGSVVSSSGSVSEIITPLLQIPPSLTVGFSYNTVASSGGSKTLKVLLVINGVETLLENINLAGASASGTFSKSYTSASTPGNNINGNRSIVLRTSNNVSVAIDDLTINAPYTYPGGCANSNAPLPVKFSGFTAKTIYDAVSLTWSVGTEENVAGYEVQRSTDGNSFSRIAFVAARGVSSYTYVDSKVTEMAFYRIRSVDNDSKYIYSSILTLKGEESGVVMKAFPMPVQSQLTVQHATATNNSKIEVLSADGRMIKSVSVSTGAQQTNVDLSSAKAGVYMIRLVNGANTETLKIIKQ